MNSRNAQFSLIIPAAGVGSRMSQTLPKQYLKIGTKTLIEHTLSIFLSHADITKIVVCVSPEDTQFSQLTISQHPKIAVTLGGKSRAESVLKGLNYLRKHSTNSSVLVHDAARPGLSLGALNKLLHFANYEHGAILALPVADTIKQSNLTNLNEVDCTLDRSRLWQAQTPQMFDLNQLHEALSKAIGENKTITDEASAMELYGHKVQLVEGELRNLKVTRPEDLEIMRFYLSQKENP